MLTLKNKHLLWIASLCSAGGVLLGASVMLDRSHLSAELEILKAKLSTTENEASQARQELKSWASDSLEKLTSSVGNLSATHKTTDDKLDGVSKQVKSTEAKLVAISGKVKETDEPLAAITERVTNTEKSLAAINSAKQERGGDLKPLSDALASLQRIEEQLKRISDQQKELMQRPGTDPREKARAHEKKADPEDDRPENEQGTPCTS